MNREEIEAEAYKRYAPAGMGFDGGEDERKSFIEGAEWMEEQYEQNRLKHSENLTKEEYDREVAFSEWFYSQGFNRQPTFSDAIEWERKQKQAEIDELSNKVSELTEALDASHVFCEGVKDLMIEKSQDAFCNTNCPIVKELEGECEGRIKGSCKGLNLFTQEIKGE